MVTRIAPAKPLRHYLKEWRLSKRLTQQELADRLPVGDDGKPTGKDQISRWERSERGMTMDVQAALAEALGIDPGSLFRDPSQANSLAWKIYLQLVEMDEPSLLYIQETIDFTKRRGAAE